MNIYLICHRVALHTNPVSAPVSSPLWRRDISCSATELSCCCSQSPSSIKIQDNSSTHRHRHRHQTQFLAMVSEEVGSKLVRVLYFVGAGVVCTKGINLWRDYKQKAATKAAAAEEEAAVKVNGAAAK